MIGGFSVGDHPLLCEGIAALANAESDMKLVAEATTDNGENSWTLSVLSVPDKSESRWRRPASRLSVPMAAWPPPQ
jgi:hypothetical protein